jgi:photosystem II stability/assembly factor-like uncharacterized protein
MSLRALVPVRAAFGVIAALFASFGIVCLLAGGARAQSGWAAVRGGPAAGGDLNAVYFLDSKRGWVAGDGGAVLRTEDGGRIWTRQSVETKDAVNDIYFRDKSDGYLLAGDAVFFTEDGGATWRAATRFRSETFGGAEPELYSVRFTSKKRGWIVGSLSRGDRVVDSLVLQTTDGGVSWQRQRVPVQDELIHLDFDGDKRGWIVGSAGRILHTRDSGDSWTLQTSGTQATLYHVDFRGDDDGWVVGERGTILRTTDGGATWATVAAPIRTTLLSVKFINGEEGWAVGRGGVILRTSDEGQTWVVQETNTKANLYALFMDKKFGWAVGANGLLLRYER